MIEFIKQKDKQQHALIGAVVALVASLAFGVAIGFAAGVMASIAIEAWQWLGNKLLEWKPEVFGKYLTVRTPDPMDALAGSLGAIAGSVLGFLIRIT